jgi:hypothetical protein
MGARNRVGIGLSPARLHSTQAGGISSLKSILGLLKSLKILSITENNLFKFDFPIRNSRGTVDS